MPKISELNAITTLTSDDLIMVVNDPAGSPSTNKITVGNFFSNVNITTKFSNTVTFSKSVTFSNTTISNATLTYSINNSAVGGVSASNTTYQTVATKLDVNTGIQYLSPDAAGAEAVGDAAAVAVEVAVAAPVAAGTEAVVPAPAAGFAVAAAATPAAAGTAVAAAPAAAAAVAAGIEAAAAVAAVAAAAATVAVAAPAAADAEAVAVAAGAAAAVAVAAVVSIVAAAAAAELATPAVASAAVPAPDGLSVPLLATVPADLRRFGAAAVAQALLGSPQKPSRGPSAPSTTPSGVWRGETTCRRPAAFDRARSLPPRGPCPLLLRTYGCSPSCPPEPRTGPPMGKSGYCTPLLVFPLSHPGAGERKYPHPLLHLCDPERS